MAIPATARPFAAAVPAHAVIRIETVSSYQEFLELEPVWNTIAADAGLDHPFLEHAWVRTWWECFGAGSALQILVVRANDEAVAIAPLILTPIRMWGIKVRRLGFFYNAHVPRADFLIARRPQEAYRAIWDHLSQRRDWDLLQLCQLPEESTTLEAIQSLAALDNCKTVTWLSGSSPYLPLHGSWARYFATLPAKHRSNLKNRVKRLSGIGPVSVETIAAGAGLKGALEAGLQLEAAAWKGENLTAISSDPEVSRFYQTLAGRAAERGWMRVHFLRTGSQRIAFDYSLSFGNRVHLLKMGYDPALAAYSPSTLLLFLLLQDFFDQDDLREYDFLGESADWKRQWTNSSRSHYWLFVFSNTFKGRCLHHIKSKIVPSLKQKYLHPLRTLLIRLTNHSRAKRT
jgi:CelD/BcsL family acetyltransferase involved in cellulose biosynthesis